MTIVELDPQTMPGLAAHLRAYTHETHDRLDKLIMAGEPFASRQRYSLFVTMQHRFHRDIDGFYSSRALGQFLPDLSQRRRLDLIEQDLADLGVNIPSDDAAPASPGHETDIATALGWLYVAEGSNLGAAFLLKEAAKLGLSETFGARHLRPAPMGRGLHWKTFVAALDRIELNEAERERSATGAAAAFSHVVSLARQHLY